MSTVNKFLDANGNVLKSPFGLWLSQLLDKVFAELDRTAHRKYHLELPEGRFTVIENGNAP